MPELTPIPSAQRPSDPGYQPVSGYAVAALVAAGVFAVILAFVAVIAVRSGRSVLSWELMVLPILGIILAIIGRSQIRNSEGTRTGLKLASVAWWICVIGGAGFATYYLTSQMFLSRESAAFVNSFFDDLRADRPHYAFEKMIPAEERGRVSPDLGEEFEIAYASAYGPFKNHELVRLFLRNGQDMQYERVGAKDIGPTPDGFEAVHVYRLRCPEGTYEATVRLLAADQRRGGKLQWRIPGMPQPHMAVKVERLSQYGRLVAELEQEGDRFANEWFLHLSAGRPALAHLKTTPLAHRQPLEYGFMGLACVAGGTAGALPVGPGLLPADRSSAAVSPFDELSAIGFFRRDAQNTPIPAEKLTKLRDLWAAADVTPVSSNRPTQPSTVPAEPVTIKIGGSDVTVVVPAELHTQDKIYYTRASIGVVCADPELVAKLAELRAKGADAPADGLVTLAKMPPRDWRIVWLATDVELHSVITGPGAPGGPGGPGAGFP